MKIIVKIILSKYIQIYRYVYLYILKVFVYLIRLYVDT